jgi:2-polyprenyl-3-methyl-5-hydroxy-6-metoxy-1,4-benzoquinol methylase
MEFKNASDIKRLQFIIDVLKQNTRPNALILDVGCGNGIISRGVGAEGFDVYGIDVSDKAIEKARSTNTLPNVRFDVINAEQLVADGKTYDAVICSEVLEHLHDPGSLLRVLYQSLKPEGKLIVTVPNGMGPRELFITKPTIALSKKDNWLWRAFKKTKALMGYKGTTIQSDAADLTHLQFFTKKSLEKLAGESHFRITRFGKTNFVENVFPFSLLANRIRFLQVLDCRVAELLPTSFTGGFVTVWEKNSR